MARQRDYRAEYARRIERGLGRGLSRSQARGHPRPGESTATGRRSVPAYDPQLEEGLKAVRAGSSLGSAARTIGVSAERLRGYLVQTGVAEKQRGRWTVGNDPRTRQMTVYSRGREVTVLLPGYEPAFLAGRYMAAVGAFLDSNDPSSLSPFKGKGVMDVRGKHHPFETRPNVLYRLAQDGGDPFEQIYRIVA